MVSSIKDHRAEPRCIRASSKKCATVFAPCDAARKTYSKIIRFRIIAFCYSIGSAADKGCKFTLMCAAIALFAAACGTRGVTPSEPGQGALVSVSTQVAAVLPIAHANNAAAVVAREGGVEFYSFSGLRQGKTHADTSLMAFVCKPPLATCARIPDVPAPNALVSEGRVAAVAVTVRGTIYIFGGYTIAPDGTEISTPDVFAFDPASKTYGRRADMPVPVDDAAAFAYQDRYIYLVSGWHDDGNVSLVQVYDTIDDRWSRASDYPGAPVFGHAGGAVGGSFVIADGVAVLGEVDGRRQFGETDQVWLGEIDAGDPLIITWTQLPPHPGGPLYRMAAAGDAEHNRIVFYGGADNPYNYNGIGYDSVRAKASDMLFAFDLSAKAWLVIGPSGKPSMDHRALMVADGAYWTLGGFDADANVLSALTRITVTQQEE